MSPSCRTLTLPRDMRLGVQALHLDGALRPEHGRLVSASRSSREGGHNVAGRILNTLMAIAGARTSMVTTQSIHTLADLVELPDDSPIYDILGGEFVVRNIPDINHAIARIELTGFLYAAYEAGYGTSSATRRRWRSTIRRAARRL